MCSTTRLEHIGPFAHRRASVPTKIVAPSVLIDYTASAQATASSVCVNNGGQNPSAQNKETVNGPALGHVRLRQERFDLPRRSGCISRGREPRPSVRSVT